MRKLRYSAHTAHKPIAAWSFPHLFVVFSLWIFGIGQLDSRAVDLAELAPITLAGGTVLLVNLSLMAGHCRSPPEAGSWMR